MPEPQHPLEVPAEAIIRSHVGHAIDLRRSKGGFSQSPRRGSMLFSETESPPAIERSDVRRVEELSAPRSPEMIVSPPYLSKRDSVLDSLYNFALAPSEEEHEDERLHTQQQARALEKLVDQAKPLFVFNTKYKKGDEEVRESTASTPCFMRSPRGRSLNLRESLRSSYPAAREEQQSAEGRRREEELRLKRHKDRLNNKIIAENLGVNTNMVSGVGMIS